MSKTYFYARVSTKEQNLDRQLREAGGWQIDEVFCDKQSGKNFDRPEYQRMKSVLQSGDTVIVKELDRLGRNKDAIKDEIRWFREQGIVFRSLDLPTTMIDYGEQAWIGDMLNNIMIEVLGAVAQQEREKILRRRQEGIDAMPVVDGRKVSKKTGRGLGRPVIDIDRMAAQELLAQGKSVVECCKELGISRSLWYKKFA